MLGNCLQTQSLRWWTYIHNLAFPFADNRGWRRRNLVSCERPYCYALSLEGLSFGLQGLNLGLPIQGLILIFFLGCSLPSTGFWLTIQNLSVARVHFIYKIKGYEVRARNSVSKMQNAQNMQI